MGIREVMIEQKVSRERATGQDKEIRSKGGEERTGKVGHGMAGQIISS